LLSTTPKLQISRESLHRFLCSDYFGVFIFINILLYSLFKESIQLIADVSQTIIVTFTVLTIGLEWRFFIKNFIFRMLLLALVAQMLSWLSSKYYIPDLAAPLPVLKSLAYLFFFFCVAFWLKGNEKRANLVLFALTLGVIFTFAYHSSVLPEIKNGLRGVRVDFHYRNAQYGSLITGACFIFYVIYTFLHKHLLSPIKLMFCIAMILLFGLFTIILQSRQSWLAITISLSAFFIFALLDKKNFPIKKILLSSVIFIVLLFFISQVPFVRQRLLVGFVHTGDLHAMLTFHWQEVKDLSIGVRLKSWVEAGKWIQAHPFFGTGFGSQTYVITTSHTLPDYITREFRHLHNSNIETLVSWGLLGFFTLYASWIYILKKVAGSDSSSFYTKALCVSFFIYWIIINNFESFFYYRAGQWVFSVFVGSLYSVILNKEYNSYLEARNENIRY
jgi:O-antigen ligase